MENTININIGAKNARPRRNSSERIFLCLICIGILAVVSSCYGRFLDNFFVYDDFRYLENLFSSSRTLLFGYNTTRFLSNLSFVPIYAVSGFNPIGYNLFNVLLHTINALLLVPLFTRLSGNAYIGGTAGLLFAASAASADSIFWKCANNGLLSALFSLLTLYLYLRWRDTGRNAFRTSSILLFIAAMFSKEDSAAVPMLVVCYELIYHRRSILGSIRLAMPYAAVVVAYLVIAQVVMKVLHVSLEHYERFLSFRPLHSLFAGYYAFVMDPRGVLTSPAYVIVAGIACAATVLLLTKNRKTVLFGLIGIILVFLPSSLTSLCSFTPKYIFMSASRYLYLPSALAALVLACIVVDIWARLPRYAAMAVIAILLCAYAGYNYSRVESRGEQWRQEGEPVRKFLKVMQQKISYFPPNSYVFAIDPPTGRAYVQQSLRAFYRNPTITWITDPLTFTAPPGSLALLLICNWQNGADDLRIDIIPFNSALFNNM